MKYNKNHEIALASFLTDSSPHEDYLSKYCSKAELLRIPKIEKTTFQSVDLLKNKFTYQNIFFSRDFNIFTMYFPKMREKVLNLMASNKFDIVYADYTMHPYLWNVKIEIPIVLEFFSPRLHLLRAQYQSSEKISVKLKLLLQYFSVRLFEISRYKAFDAGIYVTAAHKERSKPFLPKKSFVIPPGVDLEYFKYTPNSSSGPNLGFIGSMDYPINSYAVLYFCEKIFSLIKKEIVDVKFYIVGRSPPKEIKKLSLRDNSIIVTGQVDDARPYVSESKVVINPITIDDGGIKTKVLEAMAMGKPVVSTSVGAKGIGASHGKNIVLADDPKKFAKSVINLLQDSTLREKIGKNAREFVEKHYSWERMTNRLNEVFERVLEDKACNQIK